MQKITLYATATETLASVRDSANARPAAAPVFVCDVEVELHLRLFANANEQERYVLPSEIVSYGWYMDVDFDTTTAFKIVGDNADIVVTEVDDTVDSETGEITEYGYTDIKIPITNMNSEALVDWLGTNKSMSGLIGELCGYDSTGASIFVLQVEGFTVRNRISESGEPSENVESYLTLDEARALFLNDSNAMKPYIDITIHNSSDTSYNGRYYLHESLYFRTAPKMNVYARDGNRDVNGDVKTFIQYSDDLKGWVMYKTPTVGMPTAEFIYPWIKTASNPGPISGVWRKVSDPSNMTYLEAEVTARFNIAAQTY